MPNLIFLTLAHIIPPSSAWVGYRSAPSRGPDIEQTLNVCGQRNESVNVSLSLLPVPHTTSLIRILLS